MSKKEQIDAIDEIEKLEQQQSESQDLSNLQGSELPNRRKSRTPGSRLFIFIVGGLILAIGGAFTYKAMKITGGGEEVKVVSDKVTQVIPAIKPKPIKPQPVVSEPEPNINDNEADFLAQERDKKQREAIRKYNDQLTSNASPEKDYIRERMLKSSLSSSDSSDDTGSSNQGNNQLTGTGLSNDIRGNELSDKLEPMKLAGSKAGILPNRDLLMTEGTMLDCILQTKIVTSQPGMTRCVLSRDVYSDSGRVVLLDRGSVLTGFYQSGITQGQARIFVQWSRVRTPNGISIELASPGAGSLGEAGLGGYVDNHFWKRFGGSIMISMIGDLGQWASNQGRKSGDNSIQFSNTSQGVEQAAAEALRNSINIPPTLYKNQGERVSVFLARDLDFSDVYSLEAR